MKTKTMKNEQPKRLIAGLILSALLIAPLASIHGEGELNGTNKLNIVFLLADDLRPDCLGILGNPIIKTPHCDKLCENGFIFRNTYVLGSDSGAVRRVEQTVNQL